MRLHWIAYILAPLALWGCQSREAMLQGTWKVEPVAAKGSGVTDALRVGFMNLLAENTTFEFNDKGSFKVSAGLVDGQGTYKWDGDTLNVDMKSAGLRHPLKFKFTDGGHELVQQTEFASDPQLRLRKQQDKPQG